MALVTDLFIGCEIGHGKIVFIMSYYDKAGDKVIYFITDNKYHDLFYIDLHDSANPLAELPETFEKLQDAIKHIFELMKPDIKLKHK